MSALVLNLLSIVFGKNVRKCVMPLEKLIEKRWTYILYSHDGRYVLSVVCGGVGLFELNLPLSDADGVRALSDSDFLDKLAAEVSHDPNRYLSLSISL